MGTMTTIQGGATTEDLVEYLYTEGFAGGNGYQNHKVVIL